MMILCDFFRAYENYFSLEGRALSQAIATILRTHSIPEYLTSNDVAPPLRRRVYEDSLIAPAPRGKPLLPTETIRVADDYLQHID